VLATEVWGALSVTAAAADRVGELLGAPARSRRGARGQRVDRGSGRSPGCCAARPGTPPHRAILSSTEARWSASRLVDRDDDSSAGWAARRCSITEGISVRTESTLDYLVR